MGIPIVTMNIEKYILNFIPAYHKKADSSLFYGIAGENLLLYDIYKITNERRILNMIETNSETILAKMADLHSTTFAYGYAGVLYSLLYLSNKQIISVNTTGFEIFNRFFENQIYTCETQGNYDLQNGLLGIALYYLELQKADKSSFAFLDMTLNILISMFKQVDEKIYVPYKLEKHQYFHKNLDFANLGHLHGMTSIIMFFLICIREGINDSRLKRCIRTFLNMFIGMDFSSTQQWPLSFCIDKNNLILDKQNSKLFFCNGDFGLANCYFEAQKSGIYQCQEYLQKIISKLRYRIENEQTIHNACFCHGQAGIYYFANKFKLASDSDKIQSILDGMQSNILNSVERRCEFGILNGFLGLATSLLSKQNETSIERVLLLN